MFPHHQTSIDNVTALLRQRTEIDAILITGSIAHGFARKDSDVDLMIVVPDKVHSQIKQDNGLHYYDDKSATYEGGYIDGKFISHSFMQQVAEYGSEPSRFAFEGAWASYSRFAGLEKLLEQIIRYPVEKKAENIGRFYAQLQAWKWYTGEAIKHGNTYLLNHSLNNIILFGGRMILAHNEKLYPYHKWFLKVLQTCPQKPQNLMQLIDKALQTPCSDSIEELYQSIIDFRAWEEPSESWPSVFMHDSELNWMDGNCPIADL